MMLSRQASDDVSSLAAWTYAVRGVALGYTASHYHRSMKWPQVNCTAPGDCKLCQS